MLERYQYGDAVDVPLDRLPTEALKLHPIARAKRRPDVPLDRLPTEALKLPGPNTRGMNWLMFHLIVCRLRH